MSEQVEAAQPVPRLDSARFLLSEPEHWVGLEYDFGGPPAGFSNETMLDGGETRDGFIARVIGRRIAEAHEIIARYAQADPETQRRSAEIAANLERTRRILVANEA